MLGRLGLVPLLSAGRGHRHGDAVAVEVGDEAPGAGEEIGVAWKRDKR